MGEEAMQTNDNIRGVEDHEEVYIPGASRLGRLNNRDLRRLNQEAVFDTRYIMLSNFSFTILSFESIYRFGKDLERYKKDSGQASGQQGEAEALFPARVLDHGPLPLLYETCQRRL